MRKYIQLMACGLLLIGLSSCNKFLDIKPVGKVIPGSVTEYRALLSRGYKSIPGDRGFVNFRSDEMYVRDNEFDQASYGYLQDWDDLSILESNQQFNWAGYYHTNYIANQLIDADGKMVLEQHNTQADADELVGEGYLLRAYMHFILVNLFGQPYTLAGGPESMAVPLILDTDTEKVRGKSSVQSIYDAILSDIASAKKLITKERWEASFTSRFNKASVSALEARVNLYMGNWKEALAASKEVLAAGYTLVDMNQEKVVLPNQYTSSENIAANEYLYTSSTNTAANMTEVALNRYAEDDQRLANYFSKTERDNNGVKEVVYKSAKGGNNEFISTFRLGEFVLTAAEAAAQLDKLPEAVGYLDQLIEKRYTPAGATRVNTEISNLDKASLLTFIYDERARELAMEGHRWFDLRRTTRQEITKTIGGKTSVLKKDDPRYTVPIPRDAIRANPGLAN